MGFLKIIGWILAISWIGSGLVRIDRGGIIDIGLAVILIIWLTYKKKPKTPEETDHITH